MRALTCKEWRCRHSTGAATVARMPSLTRGAAARLQQAQPAPDAPTSPTSPALGLCTDTSFVSERVLGLREGVHHMTDAVWASRGGVDVYTGERRENTNKYQCDHVIEVQLAEHCLVNAMHKAGVGAGRVSMAAAQSAQSLRDVLNGVDNLNVTTARVNQAKRGPFTAAMNRVRAEERRGGSMRLVSLEQLARQGKARWLVDNGTWASIEREVVCSYEACQTTVDEGADEGLRSASELSKAAVEELGATLARLGVV